jgi:hypothetical protein
MNRSQVHAAAAEIARIILTKTARKASFCAEELPVRTLRGRNEQIVLPKIIGILLTWIVKKG